MTIHHLGHIYLRIDTGDDVVQVTKLFILERWRVLD